MSKSSFEFYKKAPPDGGASSFVYPPSEANIRFFAEALQNGCVVGLPTETVYGLAALALDEQACHSIFSIKGRPLMDPLIVHVADLEMARSLAIVPEDGRILAEAFWPGPLTLVLKKRSIVPDLITAGKETVAIRMPRHPVAKKLLHQLNAPLAAPSANPFGYVSPTRPEHVTSAFGDKVPFVLDGGPCEVGLESTIVDLSKGKNPAILRPGAVTAEQISDHLRLPVQTKLLNLEETEAATAPGTMLRHYSPKTKMIAFELGSIPKTAKNEAIAFLQRPGTLNPSREQATFWFSEDGDMEIVARTLFDLLRKLDAKGFERIFCELPPANADGLVLAIRDRLSRAASIK
ncbi:threonylcarbamoyl-AMP synthase [Puniceicoccales bacterium CK1056]|uniref:Threonylcarbamoyl-AMP synthase n=1 Tax=Oceanipulchritudo coccoides TaxID=2706888 RepID=A0A6B2M1I5_9BACT|nr:threonylcarbamoyl-AMP synthase [Oceanipulchritudo coccoides]